ncbi:MAG: hypothetical protein L6V93_02535 [Clostridiales bacterium]|nr:MAG: hypothetical protein L6V93_02535 [Clostridiales bacterium]
MPWNIYIIDITYDFCRRIIENEKIETTAAECFKDMVFKPVGERKKAYSFLEQHGFGFARRYRVVSLEFFYKRRKRDRKKFEQRNHIKLWNILAKIKIGSVRNVCTRRFACDNKAGFGRYFGKKILPTRWTRYARIKPFRRLWEFQAKCRVTEMFPSF